MGRETVGYEAVVEKVITNGKHGPYVVTRSETLGIITFALREDVWPEETTPEPGEMVILSRLVSKRAGWRARRSRYVRPTDTSTSNRKEQ